MSEAVERKALWMTNEQIVKLRTLTLARMHRVAKLVDKWNIATLSTYSETRKITAQLRRDYYQSELDMLEVTWNELRDASHHQV